MRGIPSDAEIPEASLGIGSDSFDLEEQPKRVAVIGAGYIPVGLAGEGGLKFGCGGDGGALKR
jgi:pyruvate/2-oxoglutarate dehydrogenase complex dihydrolipoamide dehydrogenase (E3) component